MTAAFFFIAFLPARIDGIFKAHRIIQRFDRFPYGKRVGYVYNVKGRKAMKNRKHIRIVCDGKELSVFVKKGDMVELPLTAGEWHLRF